MKTVAGMVLSALIAVGLMVYWPVRREYDHPRWAQPKWTLQSEVSPPRAKPGYTVWGMIDDVDNVEVYVLVSPYGDVVDLSVLRPHEIGKR